MERGAVNLRMKKSYVNYPSECFEMAGGAMVHITDARHGELQGEADNFICLKREEIKWDFPWSVEREPILSYNDTLGCDGLLSKFLEM